jgi:hypothetical protein
MITRWSTNRQRCDFWRSRSGQPSAGCPPRGPGRALFSASGSYFGLTAKRTACRTLGDPWDTRRPALCRLRARWKSVLLDPLPSLLTLRRRCSVVVRMIHRYYPAV